MATNETRIVTVAIDFGTTYSGYAYSFKSDYKNDPRKIICNSGLCGDGLSFKIPTAVLLKFDDDGDDFKVKECGSKAEQIYSELDEDERGQYELVKQFKMKLYSESAAMGIRCDSEISLSRGKGIQVVRLFSIFIKYLKRHFFDVMEKRGLKLKESDVNWVLTVPAIWTDGAKQFMRKAAQMAGIDGSQLSIALEPEAAALSCVHLADPTATDGERLVKIGTKFLVIDAGGGTVDYTILQTSHGNRIDIIQEASGGPWGGTTVDNGFYHILKENFGSDVFDTFEKSKPGDLLDLKKTFEVKKRDVSADTSRVTMRFPLSFSEIYEQTNKIPIEKANTKYGDKVKIVGDKVRIDSALLKSVFDESCKKIILHTQDVLRKSGNVNALLLVGGFGGSNLIRGRVREAFPNIRIITPEDPELSVLKGAVLYGHDPKIVKSRIAKYTYGTETCMTFIEGTHPDEKKKIFDNIEHCTDIFHIHVTKGQKLEVGKPQSRKEYTPARAKQKQMAFKIYASTEENPSFVTDDSCTYIGKFVIDTPDTTGGANRKVFAQMSFGETEMDVKATEDKTGQTVSARLHFLG